MEPNDPQNTPPAPSVPPVQETPNFDPESVAQQGVGEGNAPVDSRLGSPAEPRFPNPDAQKDHPEGEGGEGGAPYDGGEIPQVDEQQVEEALDTPQVEASPLSTTPHEQGAVETREDAQNNPPQTEGL